MKFEFVGKIKFGNKQIGKVMMAGDVLWQEGADQGLVPVFLLYGVAGVGSGYVDIVFEIDNQGSELTGVEYEVHGSGLGYLPISGDHNEGQSTLRISDLVNGVEYSIRLRATNANGSTISPWEIAVPQPSVLFTEGFDGAGKIADDIWTDPNNGNPIAGTPATLRLRTEGEGLYVQVKHLAFSATNGVYPGTRRIEHPFSYFRLSDPVKSATLEYDLYFEHIWDFNTIARDRDEMKSRLMTYDGMSEQDADDLIDGFGDADDADYADTGFPYQVGKLHGLVSNIAPDAEGNPQPGPSGGQPKDPKEWSARIAWVKNVHTHPAQDNGVYTDGADPNVAPAAAIYYYGQDREDNEPGKYIYMDNFAWEKQRWYRIKLHVQLNDYGKANGVLKLDIHDRSTMALLGSVSSGDIWLHNTEDISEAEVYRLMLSTFYGGGNLRYSPKIDDTWEDDGLVDVNNGVYMRNNNFLVEAREYLSPVAIVSAVYDQDALLSVVAEHDQPVENVTGIQYQVNDTGLWIDRDLSVTGDQFHFTVAGLQGEDQIRVRVIVGDRISAKSELTSFEIIEIFDIPVPTGNLYRYWDPMLVGLVNDTAVEEFKGLNGQDEIFLATASGVNRPQYLDNRINGQGAIVFDGIRYLTEESPIDRDFNEFSLFLVSKADEQQSGSILATYPNDNNNRINVHVPYYYKGTDFVAWDFGDRNDGGRVIGDWNSSFAQYYLWEFRVKQGYMSIYRNGELLLDENHSDTANFTGLSTVFEIGRFIETDYFVGELALMFAYDAYIGDFESKRLDILNYIATRFNLPITIPTISAPAVTLNNPTEGDGSLVFGYSINDGNSALTLVRVRHRETGGVWGAWSDLPLDLEGEFTVGGLTNGTEYEVELEATNAEGSHSAIKTGTPQAPVTIENVEVDDYISDFNSPFNVRDGILEAYDVAEAQGAKLIFSGRVYEVSATFTFSGSVNMEGVIGQTEIKRVGSHTTSSFVRIAGNNTNKSVKGINFNANQLALYGLQVQGNGATALIEDCDVFGARQLEGNANGRGVYIRDNIVATMRRCKVHTCDSLETVSNPRMRGIFIGRRQENWEMNVLIEDCEVYEIRGNVSKNSWGGNNVGAGNIDVDGILVDSNEVGVANRGYVTIRNCTIRDCEKRLIKINGADHIYIEDCDLVTNLNKETWLPIAVQEPGTGHIKNCTYTIKHASDAPTFRVLFASMGGETATAQSYDWGDFEISGNTLIIEDGVDNEIPDLACVLRVRGRGKYPDLSVINNNFGSLNGNSVRNFLMTNMVGRTFAEDDASDYGLHLTCTGNTMPGIVGNRAPIEIQNLKVGDEAYFNIAMSGNTYNGEGGQSDSTEPGDWGTSKVAAGSVFNGNVKS